ncbi:hypothetical protein [Actinomycetospora straminea]|uniref:Gp5/Type VI secretion system Vgr protein OB-fold domain-containing protein n=1 Tax=Actinomycetospora straminea TaxID=663607 RepID=A0ABP9EHU1_9PSEU|nr:hypothetical protein [Actinomycetospora straminea]MDD7933735.1 hypothetical protein [Actinomycetospora straminea]
MILAGHDPHSRVGTQAGWALTFHAETGLPTPGVTLLEAVTSDRYDATILATLPGGLEGGSYTITVEGMVDADHLALAARAPRSTVLRLHLFWYDTGGIGGYLAGIASLGVGSGGFTKRLVAELTVVEVTRRAGARRYETVITARERVFERLSAAIVQPVCVASPKVVAELAAQNTGIPLTVHTGFHPDGTLPGSSSSEVATALTTLMRGETWRDALGRLARAMEDATASYGRGVLLVRDGGLHLGVRDGPVGGGIVEVTPSKGLVEVGGAAAGEGSRVRRTLVLKGRPDLKPGAVVKFDMPPTERTAPITPSIGAAITRSLGAVGPARPSLGDSIANPQLLYVESVAHRLGRTSGFVTTVTGVEVDQPGPAEQLYESTPPSGPPRRRAGRGSGDTAERAALAVGDRVTDALSALRLINGGEVRAATAAGAGSATEPPRRTTTVWRGLVDPDGHPNRITRLPVRREHPDVRERVPQASPFAWGATGLVVPRYPGTRVLLAHGHGDNDDPVEVGAVWEAGSGPDAHPGDWWLILPAEVDATQRASLPDDTVPEPYTGKVTQDLVDADGNRVIEVGELTIRVTREALSSAGTRAKRAGEVENGPADSVTIEHADAGSSIVMTSDGTVHITAKRIALDAGDDGEISLNAKSVNVTVGEAMDVSKQ